MGCFCLWVLKMGNMFLYSTMVALLVTVTAL